MAKFFNTAGPIQIEDHYCIPVSQRINLPEIQTLIDQKKYFVLHAPRQSGKTTALLGLCKILNASGRYKCLYVNVESAQTSREKVAEAMTVIVNELINLEAIHFPEDKIMGHHGKAILQDSATSALIRILRVWARESALPTVLIIDDIDSLMGDTLVSVLRQLRGGYHERPKNFPQSVILCGVRDVMDYKIHASIEPMLLGKLPPEVLEEDVEYVTDLGLVTKTSAGFVISNPIYHEVIPRQLTYINQILLDSVVTRQWYINADGSIAVEKLLQNFQKFSRENSESWVQRFDRYHEAGPQLLLQAYLQWVAFKDVPSRFGRCEWELTQ